MKKILLHANPIKMEFFSIGVYNSSEEEFFKKLVVNQIDTFCDIRQRRGVRGSQYAFVNSNRLQKRLRDLGLNYFHILDLAPTADIRNLQKEADLKSGELKRTRGSLGKVFSIAYKEKILNEFNFPEFIETMNEEGAKKIAFFCVEEKPEACHRSIVTERLKNLGYNITHL